MTDTPPRRLYKYQRFSAQALTALKTRTIWFGRPDKLNDPFDCAVPLRFAEVGLEDCVRMLGAKGDAEWGRIKSNKKYVDATGRPTEELRSLLQEAGEKAFREHSEKAYWRLGVTCFSEVPDSTLLWSHYGGGHRGLCLEFDTSSPWLSKLHKVRYSDDIPEIDVVDELIGRDSRVLEPLLTKAACWSYEREWRAIHNEADTAYCYGVEALAGVYLGARLTEAEKDLVAHTLHGAPTRLYAVGRDDTSFRLRIQTVKYTPFQYPPRKQSGHG